MDIKNSPSPIIYAADNEDLYGTIKMVDQIQDHICMVKIGMQLFSAYGIESIYTDNFNIPVFLDLKLHDIPNTVAKAIEAITYYDHVEIITIHSSGGKAMINAALKAASKNHKLKLAAVSILTSLVDQDVIEMGFNAKLEDLVFSLSNNAYQCGIRNFVCSPFEAKFLKDSFKDITTITPGISTTVPPFDQKRVASPIRALQMGADKLVIGRSISEATDPIEAAKALANDCRKFRLSN